jgi:NagD protein
MIVRGAKLIATNLDPNCPTESGSRPGCGALVALLESASGVKAFSVGKPSPVIMRAARKQLNLTNRVHFLGAVTGPAKRAQGCHRQGNR